ncbi:MAG: Gfo/Idh/MocA family oxidoreductase [Verrucomicrobiota bacterium]|nr:Gfo/Idh/MocA family oxidoreductase [Verrucomicrobiota bacterium]
MKTRFAFAGFRHGHILDLFTAVSERADTKVVACCEEDAGKRAELAANSSVTITHPDFATMLRAVECDVIAIGDYYGRRGALAMEALRAGRHVLSDKPLCTTLEEQSEIERLAAEGRLKVGLQLDCRGYGAFRTLRDIIRGGEIGEVCTIRVDGQHPLLPGTRPAWYFEPGKHGGTINDIGIHAFDLVRWMTGLEWRGITTARAWNAKAREFPHFQDCAQLMGTLGNGAGVLADFSYLAPDRLGYKLPHYWHVLVHGTRGLAETHLLAEEVTLIADSSTAPELRRADASCTRSYLDDFLHELGGKVELADLTSADCLRASRLALEAQRVADCH